MGSILWKVAAFRLNSPLSRRADSMSNPDADPSEPCFEPSVVKLLRQIEAHARSGDIDWLKQHGKVYAAVEAA